MAAVAASLFVLATICSFDAANSSSLFYLHLDEFENYEGLLSTHLRCDSGRPCDPIFFIKVRGIWGEAENKSNCYSDANYIKFDGQIGGSVSNPLIYPQSSMQFPIGIDIRVKDCLLGSPADDIADFYEDLTTLPKAYLFGEAVNPQTDADRVHKLELQSLQPAPMTIKLRISVWHQCAQYYYGSDCSKFCKSTLPGYECNRDGVPTCTSACQVATTAASTTQSTQASSTVASSKAATASATTSARVSGTRSASAGTPAEAAPATRREASVTTATASVASSAWLEASAGGVSDPQALNTALVATMGALLAVVLLAIVAMLVLMKLCRRRRPPQVVMVTGVRFNQNEIGLNYANPSAYEEAAAAAECDGAAADHPRTDSGVYEEPIDPGERDLPQLPARERRVISQCRSFDPSTATRAK